MGNTMNEQNNEQIELVINAQRWKMAFFGLIILIAGVFIGAVLSPAVMPRPAAHLPGVESVNKGMIRRLQEDLNLSPEQTRQVSEICNKHIQALNDIRRQARPKIAEQMNELYSEVASVLDEDQQELWKQSMDRLTKRFSGRQRRNRRGRRGPGGPGGERGPGANGQFRHRNRPFDFWQEEPDHRSPRRDNDF